MISFIKKNLDWFIIAFHSFILFFAIFVLITHMDISGWIFVFFLVYTIGVFCVKIRNTKTFKSYLNKLNIKR